jgi:phage terminase large subunit
MASTHSIPLLNPALRDFWVKPARGRTLYGGRASSKTYDAAGMCIYLASNFQCRFLCTRQFQNKLAESVYSILVATIDRFGLRDEFDVTDRSIVHRRTGSDFLFYGLARNLNEIKGVEGVDVCWIEEAQFLTKAQWEILEPTVRKEGSQFWVIFNPQFATDFAYQRFVLSPPPNWIVRQINYPENPFLSKTMLDVIAAAKAEDEDDYAHIYLGVPLEDTEGSVIKRSWIEAAIDAHVKLGFEPEGAKVIGYDVADSGEDKCALLYRHGSVALWGDEWKAKEDELLKSCSRAFMAAVERGAAIKYDCIGVGATAGAKFDELNKARHVSERIRYSKFNAGAPVDRPDAYYVSDAQGRIKNKDFFANLKAQAWWTVADRFRNSYNAIHRGETFRPDEMISISSAMPNLEKLKAELATPKRDFDANGRVKVESKSDLAKATRLGGAAASPNCADSFIMAFAQTGQRPMKITPEVLAEAARR